ncbi:putative nucleotidyltransferase, ribonuclease H [Tanacetum coccineum]|uniref:Nucleotidyltransferase, ribonuclease H n=1 Tax=Tanacetum coccineum TaxID=301880 RepID=A0ABQ5I8T4_9ASTR
MGKRRCSTIVWKPIYDALLLNNPQSGVPIYLGLNSPTTPADSSQSQQAQDRMRNQANSQQRELSFQVGDYVFQKIQPYRQRSLAKRRYEKLSPRFFGPYRVKRVVGPVAYELQLPSDARIHPVFHVSMLKPAHSSFDDAAINPLPVTKDWEADLQPDSVISHRWVSEARNLVLELLISWSNRPVEEATWESYDLLKEQFPNFALRTRRFTGKEVMIQLGYMCIPGNRSLINTKTMSYKPIKTFKNSCKQNTKRNQMKTSNAA